MFSPLWILYHRSREEETPAVHAAHERLGPIIRLAPNEISVNSVDGGIRAVYAGGYQKGDWYDSLYPGIQMIFAYLPLGIATYSTTMALSKRSFL